MAVSLLMYCLKDSKHDTITDPNSLFGLAETNAKTSVILEQNCQLFFVTGQASAAHQQHPCTLGKSTAASTQLFVCEHLAQFSLLSSWATDIGFPILFYDDVTVYSSV